MRPFGCPVTILNTKDQLGKFDGKADEGFFIGYSLNSKAFRVFSSRTRIVEKNLHIRFSESTPNVVGSGPDWLCGINALTRTMNYEPIVTGTQSNGFTSTKASDNAGQARKKTKPLKDYILLPLLTDDPPFFQDLKSSHDDGLKPSSDDGKKVNEDPRKENGCNDQEKEDNVNSTNNVNTISSTVNVAGTNEDNELSFDPNMLALEDVAHLTSQIRMKMMIEEEVHVCQPPGFEDPDFPNRVYKVERYCMDYIKLLENEVKNASTLIETQKPLLKDKDGEEVDVHMYRSMIGSMMYLTSLRPDNMFAVCACARYQVNPKFWSTAMAKTINGEVQIHARVAGKEIIITESSVRRDLRLEDEKGVDCLLNSTIFENLELMRVEKGFSGRIIDLFLNEAVYKELDDRLVRVATTAFCLKAEKDSGNIDKTQSKATPNEASFLRTTSGGGPRCQEAMRDTIAQTRFENVSKLSNDSLLAKARVDSSEDDQSLSENASKQRRKINKFDVDEDITLVNDQDDAKMFDVIDLHGEEVSAAGEVHVASIATFFSVAATITTNEITLAQVLMEIKTSKPKAKGVVIQEPTRVDSSEDDQSLSENASKQRRKINKFDVDEDITLVNDQDDAKMFDVIDLHGEEVSAAGEVYVASIATFFSVAATITTNEITLAQVLMEIKTSKPKAKGVVIQEPSESITITTTIISLKNSQDKGKAIMTEEPGKLKKKDQIRLDEEAALKLPAEFDEEQRLARERD
nr:ribonuclease H-like domain-containing protein [Tanacetum cinerariifolium]